MLKSVNTSNNMENIFIIPVTNLQILSHCISAPTALLIIYV